METTVAMQHELSLKNACVEFMFAYQQKNIDKMLSLCNADGIVEFVPLGDAGTGKIGELGKGIWTALIDCFPDIDNTLDAAVAEDESTIRCQVVIRGTQAKDFAGIESKGKNFDSDHIFVFRFSYDNIIEHITVTWDHSDFMKQLGA